VRIEAGRLVTRRAVESLSRRCFGRLDRALYDRILTGYWHQDEIRKARENELLFARIALRLRLDRSPPLDILDLGGKAGTFAFVCRCLGHQAWNSDLQAMLDQPPNPELGRLLDVPSFALAVSPFQHVPFTGRTYDLITGFRTRFHSRYTWETGLDHEIHWGPAEWDFFLRDLAKNHLRPGGRIFFQLNRLQEREKGDDFPPPMRAYFASVDGELDDCLLLFRDLTRLRTRT
jgi:hypothetical protein